MKNTMVALILLAFLLVCSPRAHGADKLGSVTVTMTGSSGQTCWLHVSDGTTLFVLSEQIGIFSNCPITRRGSGYLGGWHKHGGFAIQYQDKHGKTKTAVYSVRSQSDATTTQ
jgi:hypothetical protein